MGNPIQKWMMNRGSGVALFQETTGPYLKGLSLDSRRGIVQSHGGYPRVARHSTFFVFKRMVTWGFPGDP